MTVMPEVDGRLKRGNLVGAARPALGHHPRALTEHRDRLASGQLDSCNVVHSCHKMTSFIAFLGGRTVESAL